MDYSVHEHCFKCFSRWCTINPDGFASCKMVDCEVGCGSRFHQCKSSEHSSMCMEERVPCINAVYGCRLTMNRSKLGCHLQYCPASVMCCPLEWNRWPLHSQEKNFKMALPLENTPVRCGQLDMALALRDQRMLIESFKAPAKTRNSLRNNFTKKYPAAPISHRCCSIESDDYTSEDTSHGISDDDDAPWKLGRMPPGLQRSICSQLYKAAKQASNPETLTVTLDLVPNNPGNNDADKRKHVDIHISESESDRSRSSSVEFQTSATANLKIAEPVSTNNSFRQRKLQLHDILGVDLTIECISKFKSKSSSMYTFLCAQNFRRDEFPSHSKNVHNDIQSGLNGMLEQRCPLAYLGCTFTFRKLRPKSDNASIVHSTLLESFGLRYKIPGTVDPYLCSVGQNTEASKCDNCSQSCSRSRSQSGDCTLDEPLREDDWRIPTIHTGLTWDSPVEVKFDDDMTSSEADDYTPLLNLPFEILQFIIRRLDSFSICNLSMTCCQLRDVCCSLLDERGIVTQIWERQRRTNENGDVNVTWNVKCNRWCFSTAFTPVESWVFMDHPSIGEHLKVCQFNKDKLKWSEKFCIIPHESVVRESH